MRELVFFLAATGNAYGKQLTSLQKKRKFRNPDELGNPAQELKRLVPEYQKIDGARRIGAFMNIQNPRSSSFHHLTKSILKEAN